MRWLKSKYRGFLKVVGLSLLKIVFPLSLAKPRKLLTGSPIRILIDNSIIGHSVYAEHFRVEDGIEKWGDIEIPRMERTTQPVYDLFSDGQVATELNYLFPICELIKEGTIAAFTSRELELEAIRQPKGRFLGYSKTDISLFSDIKLPSIDGYAFRPLETASQQSERLAASSNELFSILIPFFSRSQSLDVWHLATCEGNGVSFFLTLDFKFVRSFTQARRRKGFPHINVVPITPKQFAEKYEIQPYNPALLDIAYGKIKVDRYPHSPLNKRTSPRFKEEEFPEEFMTTLPKVKSVKGIGVNISQSYLSIQYIDENDKQNQLSMNLQNALYLLSMLKSLQLNLDIPFPDDPRNPDAPAIKPSDRQLGD